MEQVQVKKEQNSSIVISSPEKKTVLLCFNGFQNADTHDAIPMCDYYAKEFEKDTKDCIALPVMLYEPTDKKTHSPKHFARMASLAIEKYHEEGYDIVLFGYSFSASLACKMQKKYPYIRKMILAAPVYDTFFNGMIPHYIQYAMKFARLKKKYGSRLAKTMGRQTTIGCAGLLITIFLSVLKNRKYFGKVRNCDTLLLWGDEDPLCTKHSLGRVEKKLSRTPHMLYVYPGLAHTLMKSVRDDGVVFEDVLHFAFNTPFKMETSSVALEKKKKEKKVKLDEDGYPIPTFSQIFSDIDPEGDRETVAEQRDI